MLHQVIFDWKRTLYDPDKKELIDGALDILEFIEGKNIPMILIGKGGDDMQLEVNRLGVGKYFKEIVFAQGEKDPKVFARFLTEDPRNTFFIGDRVRSELEIGNKLGATTVWVKQGKFALEEPKEEEQNPGFTVSSLADCLNLFQDLI